MGLIRPKLSLRARALGWLAQREHSRDELRRKLLTAVRHREQAARAAGPAEACDGHEADAGDVPAAAAEAEVDALLDALAREGWQSDARATDSRLRSGAARSGLRKLAADLQQRGLTPSGEVWEELQGTEEARARALLRKRFGDDPPQTLSEQARRTRFLLNRGFASGLAMRLAREGAHDDAA